ncbi:MAG: RNA methyltransferase [[Bacteroides] pectinophilus]|nr:RNA methyltransferase [[Bacteroides] pectinophilus]
MITSTGNARVKNVIQLQTRARARKDSRQFVAEGFRMVSEAPADRIVSIYASETFARCNSGYMSTIQVPYETVSDNVFAQMSDTRTPQGILAVIKMAEYEIGDIIAHDNGLYVIVENLQDPGNLGTIIRMSEAAGVDGIIMSPNTVDIYNPKTIRSTMGSLYRVPFVYADDFAGTLKRMKSKGVELYAAHLEGSVEYTEPDYTKASAFVIGNEGNGLTDAVTNICSNRIRIPMAGKVESLNAAIAASVLTFEAARQRRNGKG